jgi:hypothetical protein
MEQSVKHDYNELVQLRYLNELEGVDCDSRFEVINLSEWIDKLNFVSNNSDNEIVIASRKHLDVPNVVITVATSSNNNTVVYPFTAVRRIQPQRVKSPFTLNDWFISAGGPVWALDCKDKNSKENESLLSSSNTYIAIGLSRIGWERKGDNIFNRNPNKMKELGQQNEYDVGCDYKQFVNRRSTNPSLLEIWKYSQGSDEPNLKLEYLIGFASRGPVWQARWSPISFSDVGVVGMIALVFGDGTCAVMLVHTESIINNINQTNTNNFSTIDPMEYSRNIPLVEGDSMLLWELSCRNERVMSCSWSLHDPWLIACGMSDGSVCLWQLASSRLQDNGMI